LSSRAALAPRKARPRPSLLRRVIAGMVLRKLLGHRWTREGAVDTDRFRIRVEDPVKLDRIRAILGAFFSGLELSLEGTGYAEDEAARLDALHRPFFVEGAAMGVIPGSWTPLRREERVLCDFVAGIPPDDPHIILKHIGIGFWLGFGQSGPERALDRAADLVDPAYRLLLHDGLGFKTGFFDLPRAFESWGRVAPSAADLERSPEIRALRELEGSARASAMSGLGRSLWFFSMDRPRPAFDTAHALGPDAGWVLGGLGLAAAYTFPDDLGVAYGAENLVVEAERPHFRKGIRIALYARRENDAGALDGWMRSLPAALRERAESDLEIALQAGMRTRGRADFVPAFHAGCLGDAGGRTRDAGGRARDAGRRAPRWW